MVSLFMRAYVVVLFVSSTFISVSTLRILARLFRRNGDASLHGETPDFKNWTGTLQARFRLVGFLALLLAVITSREVLASIFAVRVSFSRYRLEDALEAPTAFCLVSTLILAFVYALLWCTEREILRCALTSSIPQANAQ
jgi:hypothetical protein